MGERGEGKGGERVRRTPYTERGLRRLRCVRCPNQASEQWDVRSCRAGVYWGFLPLCDECDATLNEMVLGFFPDQRRASA